MEISTIREKILTDDDFVKEQIQHIVQYYGLKHTIRYNHTREKSLLTESVAEHVYCLHVLCDYFSPLHQDLDLDLCHIKQMITWHDMAEALVGDMTSQAKTADHRQAEKEAELYLIKESPAHLTDTLKKVFADYNETDSVSAKFATALDKLEPMFHLYTLTKLENFKAFNLKWTSAEYKEYRKPKLEGFPILQRFDDILAAAIENSGYFPRE